MKYSFLAAANRVLIIAGVLFFEKISKTIFYLGKGITIQKMARLQTFVYIE